LPSDKKINQIDLLINNFPLYQLWKGTVVGRGYGVILTFIVMV